PQLVGKNSVPMNEPYPEVERVRRARIRPVIQLVEFQLDLAIEIIVIRRVAGRVLEQIGGRGTSLSRPERFDPRTPAIDVRNDPIRGVRNRGSVALGGKYFQVLRVIRGDEVSHV